MGMEIERKFLITDLPENLSQYPFRNIEQAYLNFKPAIRIRHEQSSDREKYELTYKGSGLLSHSEYNLPLDASSYAHLLEKHDGMIIRKRRYMLPYGNYTIELDLFDGDFSGLILAEVEFPSVEEANAFVTPSWFREDVTMSGIYSNARMAQGDVPKSS